MILFVTWSPILVSYSYIVIYDDKKAAKMIAKIVTPYFNKCIYIAFFVGP